MPPGLPFPKTAACLGFPFPLTSAVPVPSTEDPGSPRGSSPSLVTSAAPTDTADVPWEGNTLQHPGFGTFLCFCSQEHRSSASLALWQGGGWVQAGTPSCELGTGHHGLAQPQPQWAAGGSFFAWTGR